MALCDSPRTLLTTTRWHKARSPRSQRGTRVKWLATTNGSAPRDRIRLNAVRSPETMRPDLHRLSGVADMQLICPHCNNTVDLGEGSAPEEVLCTACGSSFR